MGIFYCSSAAESIRDKIKVGTGANMNNKIERRAFLLNTASSAAALCVGSVGLLSANFASAQVSVQGSRKYGVKALVFDMFGTVLDWRPSVARESEKILKPLGYNIDWLEFATAWRREYDPSMAPIRDGKRPFVVLDVLHRESLDKVLPKFGVKDLPEATKKELNFAWHKLDGWPDVTKGMEVLSRNFFLAPCSNGNVAMMADIARHNKIRFDSLLGAETAQDYKPKPRVYLQAAEAFGLQPKEVMMICAAGHSGDLVAAAAQGLRTGTVARPNESGPGKGASVPTVPVDVIANDLNDLSAKLMA